MAAFDESTTAFHHAVDVNIILRTTPGGASGGGGSLASCCCTSFRASFNLSRPLFAGGGSPMSMICTAVLGLLKEA